MRALVGFLLLWLIIGISLVAGPIALLVLFQLQFLPYHSEWITNWQRVVVVIDLGILWPCGLRSRAATQPVLDAATSSGAKSYH